MADLSEFELYAAIVATRDPETSAAIHRWKAERQRVPIDEILSRHKLGHSVAARIRRLNPNGLMPGSIPRGWHPHQRLSGRWDLDVTGPREFIKRFGRDAYRRVPRSALFRRGHRKAITHEWIEDNMRTLAHG